MAAYYKESMDLLKKEKGWFKKIVLAGLVRAIPIIGWFGETGYYMEWARRTAWGIDSAPDNKADSSVCLGAGWRSFLAMLGYSLAWLIISCFFVSIEFDPFISWLLGFFISFILGLAMLLAAIYDDAGAGYGFKRMVDLIKGNPADMFKIIGFDLIYAIITGIIYIILFMFALLPMVLAIANAGIFDLALGSNANMFVDDSLYYNIFMFEDIIAPFLGQVAVFGLVFYIIDMIVKSYRDAIYYTMIALFVRQTNVSAWGDIKDDLPKVLAFEPTHDTPVSPVQETTAPTETAENSETASSTVNNQTNEIATNTESVKEESQTGEATEEKENSEENSAINE